MDDAFTEDVLLFKVFKLEFSFKTHFQKRGLNAVMDASILPDYLFVGQQSISVAQRVYGQLVIMALAATMIKTLKTTITLMATTTTMKSDTLYVGQLSIVNSSKCIDPS